jgi:hypothetical protein
LSWKQVFEERVALLKVAAFDPKAEPLHALLGAAVVKLSGTTQIPCAVWGLPRLLFFTFIAFRQLLGTF